MDETTAVILARMEKFATDLIVVRGYSKAHLADIEAIRERIEKLEKALRTLEVSIDPKDMRRWQPEVALCDLDDEEPQGGGES